MRKTYEVTSKTHSTFTIDSSDIVRILNNEKERVARSYYLDSGNIIKNREPQKKDNEEVKEEELKLYNALNLCAEYFKELK